MERLERIVRSDLSQLTKLDQELTALRTEQADLTRAIDAHSRELVAVERSQAARIQAQIEQNLRGAGLSVPAASAPSSSSGHMNYGLSLVGNKSAEARRFADQRGALALPVSGPSSIQEAQRAESGGPGLEFNAHRGVAVRAAGEGRVAFSDRYGSYGQLVILDHGDRYYTVYGGFASVDVQVGDEVSKSARLGTSGSEPIYFEVRRGTKTEDARPWLGL
jgi:septal ring factor EnvC (AmiA/AmiB activator)